MAVGAGWTLTPTAASTGVKTTGSVLIVPGPYGSLSGVYRELTVSDGQLRQGGNAPKIKIAPSNKLICICRICADHTQEFVPGRYCPKALLS